MGRKAVNYSNVLLFLLGAFSMTEIRLVGNMAISEVPAFVFAPFLFLKNIKALQTHKFMTFVSLIMLAILGCIVSSIYNSTPFPLFLRGFATLYSIFANLIIFHHLLSKNLSGLKWLILGIAVSSIISIFVFQHGMDLDGRIDGQDIGGSASEAVMGSALFWVGRGNALALLPIRAWYFETPLAYSILAPAAFAVFCIFITTSGRSAALGIVFASFLIFKGRKSQKHMKAIGRHFVMLCLGGVLVGALAKSGYSFLASNGILGEKQLEKYLHQTSQGSGVLSMLRAGRAEFFIGLSAAIDQPFMGYGPWAQDTGGYAMDYMTKYASAEDLEQYHRGMAYLAAQGISTRLLPSHSQIIGFWISYGVMGLILTIYILYLFFQFFKRFSHSIPQWFGYFALSIPPAIWHIFFSPFGARVERTLLIVCVLLARAVYLGKLSLPNQMLVQIAKNER